MVTASHNHAADNGFKVLGPGGLKPDDAQTRRLEGWATSYARGGLEGALDDVSASATVRYREAFEDAVGGLLALRGKRLAIDLAHGGASVHRDWLAAKLAPLCEVTWLGQGEGVINEGVGSEHPEALGACVRSHGLDAGLAVDGDGDRCLLVNERGEVVPGDALAWLLTKQMRLPALAVTVMSNASLEASLPGVEVIRTPVGDRHLSMAMRSRGIGLGMEDSGHALFGDGLPGGDGLLTGLRALSAAWAVAESLSEAFGGFQPFPRRLTKVRVARRPDLHTDPELVEIQRAAEERLGSGRVFLRYSGTEPVLRILVEGPDPGRVDQVSDALTGRCAEVLG
jgi:phosphoglucosamine mutase